VVAATPVRFGSRAGVILRLAFRVRCLAFGISIGEEPLWGVSVGLARMSSKNAALPESLPSSERETPNVI
jgi:hypothetical protein